MLSQETRMGALGGNAEVAEPGGEMDKQARRDLQGSFPQQFRDWVCYLAASCVFHSPGTGGREGGEGSGEEQSPTKVPGSVPLPKLDILEEKKKITNLES